MGDLANLPAVFRDSLERIKLMGELTPEILDTYFGSISDQTTFIPELVSYAGPQVFLLLVEHFGGVTLRIPKPEEILRQAKKQRRVQEEVEFESDG